MHIPSRVEVLSWNENQVADLLREHKLNDCIDCVFQRHIDGQKLLNLKEGEVLYFLEIHNSKSRGRFWDIVKQITEKKEKKGGVHSLMSRFQETPQCNNNAEEEEDESCDDTDSFESDYDEPDPDPPVGESGQPAISLERRETIRNNLLKSLMSQAAAPPVNNEEDYPTSEEIYDVPEDGCGEPEEDMYDVPSDESGGGLVGRRPPLDRKESDQYLMPDERKLFDHSQTADEEDYEDLNGVPPPMGRSDIEEQEDYVVPDTKPAVVVPPRPPKSSTGKKPLPPPAENGHREPKAGKKNRIKDLSSVFQEQENYEPPQPKRGLKKQPESPKPPKAPPKVSPQPPRFAKKIEKKPPDRPAELDPEEMYEPPDQPPRSPYKPAVKPPVEIDQENYEAPETPLRPPSKAAMKPPVKQAVKPPVEIEQENYEAPETPIRPSKKPPPTMKPPPPTTKPPPAIPEQENYEPPELQRKSKPIPIMDPEENYEDPNQIAGGMNGSDGDECDQEDYEIPDRSDTPSKEAIPEPPKKNKMKIFGRSPSKKTPKSPGKADKNKTIKNEVSATPPKPIPPVPGSKPQPTTPSVPTGKGILNKFRGEKSAEKRNSMALPSLPTDKVDAKIDFPSPPPKPSQKEKPAPNERRNMPDLPPSKPPQKSKQELLEDQPWFHGLISKKEVVDILKNAKKDGAYLVRKSSRDPDKCIMSILYKNDIRHLNIPCDEKGHYRLGDSGVERFKNIEELVTYFNKHDVEFSAGGKTHLTHACMKTSDERGRKPSRKRSHFALRLTEREKNIFSTKPLQNLFTRKSLLQ